MSTDNKTICKEIKQAAFRANPPATVMVGRSRYHDILSINDTKIFVPRTNNIPDPVADSIYNKAANVLGPAAFPDRYVNPAPTHPVFDIVAAPDEDGWRIDIPALALTTAASSYETIEATAKDLIVRGADIPEPIVHVSYRYPKAVEDYLTVKRTSEMLGELRRQSVRALLDEGVPKYTIAKIMGMGNLRVVEMVARAGEDREAERD